MSGDNFVLLSIIISLVAIILGYIISIYYEIIDIKKHFNISSFNNPVDRYTREEIISKWKELTSYCRNPRQSILTETTIQYALNRSKTNADKYLLQLISNRGCYPPRDIPQSELEYLQQLWKDSNCPKSFPIDFVNKLYSNPRMSFKLATKLFNEYILNMKKNINANDYSFESLESSFSKCYGDNWKDNSEYLTKFNIVNSIN